MKTKIEIKDEASICTIDIEGVIGVSEESQFSTKSHSVATYDRFKEEAAKIREIEAEEVVVNIRSTGGDVNDALLIYESLTSLNAKIVTRCYGYTASAATIIAQAASQGCREISASALYLIHLSSSVVEGNVADLNERIALLEKTDERLSSLYAQRSGRAKEEFTALMSENGGRGRWLSPEEVVAAGLADVVIGGEEQAQRGGLIERVKGWLNLSKGEPKHQTTLPVDLNVLHKTEGGKQPLASAIALREGQMSISSTKTERVEDPTLEGVGIASNALAYAEDALKFKGR